MSATPFASDKFSDSELSMLLDVVEHTIHCYINQLPLPEILIQDYPEALQSPGACFVTLHVGGQLQGCIGTVVAQIPLVLEVERKTRSAACQDRRFTPLQREQINDLTIEVSVLTPPQPLSIESEQDLLCYLKHRKCGVILSDGYRSALFLPQVWEALPAPTDFLNHLKQKAGWHADYWSDDISVQTFDVQMKSRRYKGL
ncbi:AmmeMemoRadiSam system protein A [Vibrio parahaemolyticus]|uniref:AmmeMemoRadiSam system protein A n=1 Tax=Vibrio mediterranei TaxID=689 RepID=UPI0040686DC2